MLKLFLIKGFYSVDVTINNLEVDSDESRQTSLLYRKTITIISKNMR